VTGRPEVDAVVVLARALEHCSFFRVVVPSRTSNGRRLSVKSWTVRVLRIVMPLVGGATELRATGHWISGRRRRTTEEVRLLDFFVRQPLCRDVAMGLAVALEAIALQMHQEALAVVVEHRLHLMRPAPGQATAADTPSRRIFIERVATADPNARVGSRASRSANA